MIKVINAVHSDLGKLHTNDFSNLRSFEDYYREIKSICGKQSAIPNRLEYNLQSCDARVKA